MSEANTALTNEQREQLEFITRCDPEFVLLHLKEHTAFDVEALRKIFELAKTQAAQQLAGPSEQSERERRLGAYVMDFARKGGWPDDGEGAFEFIQRISYAQGLEDGSAKVDDVESVSEAPEPVAEWQSRYMGDPRQPGYWSRCNNIEWAKATYALPNHTSEQGWEVRPLFDAQAIEAIRQALSPN